jgi:hypothetical protein
MVYTSPALSALVPSPSQVRSSVRQENSFIVCVGGEGVQPCRGGMREFVYIIAAGTRHRPCTDIARPFIPPRCAQTFQRRCGKKHLL